MGNSSFLFAKASIIMKITYYGHSSVMLETSKSKILFDPFITPNPAAAGIEVGELRPDYILLSHAHEDHVADMATIQRQSGAQVLAIVETAAWVRRQGIGPDHIVEFNFGGTIHTDFGSVKMVYALHTSSTPDGQYGGQPVGFVIKADEKTVYFAGDTALTMEMKLLENLGIDMALLPIGGHYTMDVSDAVVAAQWINCKQVVGIHYNTFPPIQVDTKGAKRQFAEVNITLHLPAIGESVEF